MTHLTTLFILLSLALTSQVDCNCKGLVDNKFNGGIDLFNKAGGQKLKTIQQSLTNDEYITFQILKDSADYFKMSFDLPTEKNPVQGWVKKAYYFTTTLNSYSTPVDLYKQSDLKIKKHTLNHWQDEYFTILKCNSDRPYIKIKQDKKYFIGWIDPKRQCNNPYTTCN